MSLPLNLHWVGVGSSAGSLGAAAFGGSLLGLGWVAYACVLEEPRLVQRFGVAYQLYCQRVPLLPAPRAVLCAAVLRAFIDELGRSYKRRAKRELGLSTCGGEFPCQFPRGRRP